MEVYLSFYVIRVPVCRRVQGHAFLVVVGFRKTYFFCQNSVCVHYLLLTRLEEGLGQVPLWCHCLLTSSCYLLKLNYHPVVDLMPFEVTSSDIQPTLFLKPFTSLPQTGSYRPRVIWGDLNWYSANHLLFKPFTSTSHYLKQAFVDLVSFEVT